MHRLGVALSVVHGHGPINGMHILRAAMSLTLVIFANGCSASDDAAGVDLVPCSGSQYNAPVGTSCDYAGSGVLACVSVANTDPTCANEGIVVQCMPQAAAGGAATTDGGAFTWQQVLKCPGGGACRGGYTAAGQLSDYEVSCDNVQAPLAVAHTSCPTDQTGACSLDQKQTLECLIGMWTVTQSCPNACEVNASNTIVCE